MTLALWTELLKQVGPAHHAAFAATDGADEEWPAWYAAWLLERLPNQVLPNQVPANQNPPSQDAVVDESRLAGLLEAAAEAHKTSGSQEEWPDFYARFITDRLEG